ncbi:hypothetical protein K502DRAFT_20226 [Neoconidiobolus thromboides FSU 785]|nr:hypothetical protein K502DRAFT_20226 [Neoconidiobolus thromboides FSU 785]
MPLIINFQLISIRLMGYKPLPQLLNKKIKSSLPTWKQIRKKQVVHLYRDLLKLSTQFQFDMYRNYIQNFTKERFKFHKFQYDNIKLKFLIQEGIEVGEREAREMSKGRYK